MRLRRPELHTLAGAYALDAVPEADRARFERHLARCRACAREQRELREATARLAGAVAADPPAELVERVIAAAARIRQLPPATGPAPAWPARLMHKVRDARLPPDSWRPRRRRLALALAALFLAVSAASGAIALTAEQNLGAAQQNGHAIAEVLNAPDAIMLTSRVKAGGAATIVMSHREHALVFTTAGLPPLPSGRGYQLWLMGAHGDRSAGMLPAPHNGMTSPVIATGLAAGDWVGLTIEPGAGSPQPTSSPILMLSLTVTPPRAGPAACRPSGATSASSAPLTAGQKQAAPPSSPRPPRPSRKPARSPAGCYPAPATSTPMTRPGSQTSPPAARTWTPWPATSPASPR